MYKSLIATLLIALAFPFPASALVKTNESGNTIVDKREYPIIFIHGAAGAELEKGGTNLWPAYLGGLINDSGALQMALNSDGKTDCCGEVTAPRVMRYASGYDSMNMGMIGVYQGFYDYMDALGYGYEEASKDGKVYYDFTYDWRKDNRDHTKSLDVKVRNVLKETKADKVILIGHSMGGLQARLYMKDPKRAANVGGVIFIGTPHHGAPQVYSAYTEGYNFGNPKVSSSRMWEVMKNWPAGYQLLPDYPAVQDDETGKFWTLEDMYVNGGFFSSQEYNHAVGGWMGHGEQKYLPKSGLPNAQFAKDTIAFHKYLGDSVDKYPWVKYYHIAGDGKPTLQYLRVAKETRPGFDLPILVVERVETNNGDGTVAAAGAKIEGVEEHIKVIGEHAALPGIPAVTKNVTRMREIINNETFRYGISELIKTYAEGELPTLATYKKSGGPSDTQKDAQRSLVEAIFTTLFMGVPDEKKIQLRDEVRDRAVRSFENATVNIHIAAEGTQEEDTMYLVIKGFQVVDSGSGTIDGASVTVTVDNYTTLRAIAHHQTSAQEALRAGSISFSGTGAIEGLKSKMMTWFLRYGYRK